MTRPTAEELASLREDGLSEARRREFQASARLRDAAAVLEEHPSAVQLRFLQTVASIGNEKSTVVVLPLPLQPLGLLQKTG